MKQYWWIWPFLIIGGLLIWRSQADDPMDSAGGRIYQKYCASCHLADGAGLGKLVPNLQNHPALTQEPQSLICLIRLGKGEKFTFDDNRVSAPMPGQPDLSARELHRLVNFLRIAFVEGEQESISLQAIQSGFAECEPSQTGAVVPAPAAADQVSSKE